MNSKYLLNPFNQEQTFFKDIIREFFKSEVDIYNSNEKHIWKDTFDKFLVRFEKHIYDKISEWIDVSKDAVEDYKALRFFEKIMIRDKLMTKLHPKYAIVLDKFTAEMDNIASAFTVSARNGRNRHGFALSRPGCSTKHTFPGRTVRP